MFKWLKIFFGGRSAKASGMAIAAASVIGGGFLFSQRSLDTLAPVTIEMQAVAHCAIQRSPVDFTVYHGLRSDEEHRSMLARGVSWVNRSRHQDGDAIDVMAIVDGKGTWEHEPYYIIANEAFYPCGEELGTPVTWGGEWRVKDMVHFELKRKK